MYTHTCTHTRTPQKRKQGINKLIPRREQEHKANKTLSEQGPLGSGEGRGLQEKLPHCQQRDHGDAGTADSSGNKGTRWKRLRQLIVLYTDH